MNGKCRTRQEVGPHSQYNKNVLIHPCYHLDRLMKSRKRTRRDQLPWCFWIRLASLMILSSEVRGEIFPKTSSLRKTGPGDLVDMNKPAVCGDEVCGGAARARLCNNA